MAMEREYNLNVLEAPKADKDKVACIGSGPASLSCAQRLALNGYKVTVFEEFDKPGGVLTYGIIPSRLPQDVVDFDIQKVKDLGVEFIMNTKIGRDITIDKLKETRLQSIFHRNRIMESKRSRNKRKRTKRCNQCS